MAKKHSKAFATFPTQHGFVTLDVFAVEAVTQPFKDTPDNRRRAIILTATNRYEIIYPDPLPGEQLAVERIFDVIAAVATAAAEKRPPQQLTQNEADTLIQQFGLEPQDV
jgi:hypothetical protein